MEHGITEYGPVSKAGLGILIIYSCLTAYRWVTLYFARQRIIHEYGCKPIQGRYPHKDPFLGTDFIRDAFTAKARGEFLLRESRLYEKLGPTYVFRVFGVGMISTAEPANMKAIFATKFDDWSTGERNRVLEPLLGKGIFTTEGEHWARSRLMIRPNFVRGQISDLDRLESHVQDLFRLIPADGREVDLQPLFFRLMMDSATELLFGQSVNSLRGGTAGAAAQEGRPSESAFAHAFDKAQEYCNVRFLYGPLGRIMWQAKEDRKAVALCRAFIQPYVDEAVRYRTELEGGAASEGDEGKYTFLYELAKETTDRVRLRDELINLLVAGRDTTASMLSNLFHTLAKRPDVWAKLRAEAEALGGEHPSFEKLKNMKYLQYCIKECEFATPTPPTHQTHISTNCHLYNLALRLHPPVPGLAREANKDTVLPAGGGPDGKAPLFIKKGAVVMPVFYGMHRRKDLFGPDAHEFRPERWEKLRTGWVTSLLPSSHLHCL